MDQHLDSHLNKLSSSGLVEKVANNSVIKSITDSSAFQSMNNSIRPHFWTIMTVLGVLAVISGVIGVFALIAMIAWFVFWNFLIIFIISAISVALTLIQGRGMIVKKKWFPYIAVVSFAWSILSIILQNVFWGGMVGYGGSNYVVMLIVSFIVLLFVLKNRDIFVK